MNPIALVLDAIDKQWTTVEHATSSRFRCCITLPLPDGEPSTYSIVVRVQATTTHFMLVAREEPRRARLPKACPERHINRDGSFCLGWPDAFDSWPQTPDAARIWWETLCGFLSLQDRATLLRRWPAKAWAHGGAAEAQARFERQAAALPLAIVDAVNRAAAANDHVRTAESCPCGSGKRTRECHRLEIRRLETLLVTMRSEEEAFWREWRGTPCCGTMDTCQLGR